MEIHWPVVVLSLHVQNSNIYADKEGNLHKTLKIAALADVFTQTHEACTA